MKAKINKKEALLKSPWDQLFLGSLKIPFLLALFVFVFNVSRLSISPQTGDGGEMIQTALYGGVLHPPGFPLQAWINRILILLPLKEPATRLSLGSLFWHSAGVFFLAQIFRDLKVSVMGGVIACLAYAFYPPLLYQALQPEVFALTYFLLIAVYYRVVRVNFQNPSSIESSSWKNPLWVGGLIGLAMSQHAILVCIAPAIAILYYLLWIKEHRQFSKVFFGLICTAGITFGLYASLPLLRTSSAWPNWGDLSNWEGWWTHILRKEYGTFSLMADHSNQSWTGIEILMMDLFPIWGIFFIFSILGLWKWMRTISFQSEKFIKIAFFGSLAVGFFFLTQAVAIQPEPISASILERFEGLVIIPLTLLCGIGFDDALSLQKKLRIPSFCLNFIAALGLILLMIIPWGRVDCSSDNTADVYARALSATMPPASVYMGHADLEGFYGIPTPDGKRRYPIDESLLAAQWYKKRVLPVLEPRLSFNPDTPLNLEKITQEALTHGLSVSSAHSAFGHNQNGKSQIRGLYFYSDPTIVDIISFESAKVAISLCPFISELTALPTVGHEPNREIRKVGFARAFRGAAEFFKLSGHSDLMILSNELAQQLSLALNPQAWIDSCKQLSSQFQIAFP